MSDEKDTCRHIVGLLTTADKILDTLTAERVADLEGRGEFGLLRHLEPGQYIDAFAFCPKCGADVSEHVQEPQDQPGECTPKSCPLCSWAGKIDDVKTVRYHRTPNGVVDCGQIDWQCPTCSQWIKPEDEEDEE